MYDLEHVKTAKDSSARKGSPSQVRTDLYVLHS